MPAIGPRWESQPCDDAQAGELAAALGIAPIVARLLCQRGFSDPEVASRFLNPSLDHLHDPMALAGMGAAVERILSAIAATLMNPGSQASRLVRRHSACTSFSATPTPARYLSG